MIEEGISSEDQLGEDQNALAAFSRPLILPGLTLWLTLLTDRTVTALWRGVPARQALQIETAIAGTAFHFSGIATDVTTLAPLTRLHQSGTAHDGVVVNAIHAAGGPVPRGGGVIGLLEFGGGVDLRKPFEVTLSGCACRFDLNPDAVARWGAKTRPEGRGF